VLPRVHSGPTARIYLWVLNLLGPTVRGFSRERVKWRFDPATSNLDSSGPVKLSGQLEFVFPGETARIDSANMLAAVRDALVHHGIAVAETDGFQSYDLELVVPPMIRVPINALQRSDGAIALLWRIRSVPRRALIAAVITFLILLAAGFSLRAGIVGVACAAIAVALLAFNRARRIPAIIKLSAAEVARSVGASIANRPEDEA
jgi:hypothetical protein